MKAEFEDVRRCGPSKGASRREVGSRMLPQGNIRFKSQISVFKIQSFIATETEPCRMWSLNFTGVEAQFEV